MIYQNETLYFDESSEVSHCEKERSRGGRIRRIGFPALPGCHTFGRTIEEAIDMAKEAIKAYIETFIDLGKEVPTDEGVLEYTVVVEAHA